MSIFCSCCINAKKCGANLTELDCDCDDKETSYKRCHTIDQSNNFFYIYRYKTFKTLDSFDDA